MTKRRANVQDLLLIPVVVLLVFIAAVVMGKFTGDVQQSSTLTSTTSQNALNSGYAWIHSLDSMTIFYVIIILLAVGGLAFAVKSNPILIPVFLFVGVGVIIASGALANVFQDFGSSPSVATEANQFSLMIALEQRMPYVIGAAVLLVMLLFFGKPAFMGD